MQRISSNLANDIARSLSVSGRNPTPTPSSSTDDADVVMSGSTSPMRTFTNNNNNTSSSSPPTRIYHKMISSRRSSPQPSSSSSSNNMKNDEDPSLLLQRISNGSRLPHHTMDFDEWIKAQAQRQNFNIMEYRQLFEEKQKQLHHYLSEIDGSHDPTKSDAQRFMDIKENLARILKIANDLSGDQSIAFVVNVWVCGKINVYKKDINLIRHCHRTYFQSGRRLKDTSTRACLMFRQVLVIFRYTHRLMMNQIGCRRYEAVIHTIYTTH